MYENSKIPSESVWIDKNPLDTCTILCYTALVLNSHGACIQQNSSANKDTYVMLSACMCHVYMVPFMIHGHYDRKAIHSTGDVMWKRKQSNEILHEYTHTQTHSLTHSQARNFASAIRCILKFSHRFHCCFVCSPLPIKYSWAFCCNKRVN